MVAAAAIVTVTLGEEVAWQTRPAGTIRPTKTARRESAPGAIFCEGYHKASKCPKCPKISSTQTAGGPKHGGVLTDLRTNSTLGIRLDASLGVNRALTAKATVLQRNQRAADGFWIDDSGASESITADATGFESYERTSLGKRVKSADGKLPPAVGYGPLHLLVNQENGTFQGETQQLALERAAHVPGMGHHSLIPVKALAKALDASMHIYPRGAMIQP